ncbi:hypothetical protein ABN763_09415 [Spongiivirga sp. MCCC 1A20706]|uniref:hypothetical protein n=1 Tax=Spongiivirga sp. MCCC 1A20706 TaxID=3160963 RepID=UPI0039775939
MKFQLPLYLFRILLILFLFVSCQDNLNETAGVDEREQVEEEVSEAAFTKNDPLMDDILSLAVNDGAKDDVLDGLSKSQIVLPVDLTMNNQSFKVEMEDDLFIAKAVANYSNQDDDKVTFQYPITIRLDDYSEQILNNETEFLAMKEELQNEPMVNRISCSEIMYPFNIAFFNKVSGDRGIIRITTDQKLMETFNSILDSDVLEIEYPVEIKNTFDSETVFIEDNDQFKIEVTTSQTTCDAQPEVQPTGMVTVCHNVSNNPRNLEINISALEAHLRHGDILGGCN